MIISKTNIFMLKPERIVSPQALKTDRKFSRRIIRSHANNSLARPVEPLRNGKHIHLKKNLENM